MLSWAVYVIPVVRRIKAYIHVEMTKAVIIYLFLVIYPSISGC